MAADAAGVSREAQPMITYAPESTLTLSGVRVSEDALVGPADGSALGLSWCRVATAATCSAMVGVSATAVKLTAEYTKTREQFGHPIALFQAVGQRAADAFIDAQGIRLTSLQASWSLAEGLPADREVAVAKYFAAEAGPAGGARNPAPARRHRRRPRLPAAPLLPVGQAHGADPRQRHPPSDPARAATRARGRAARYSSSSASSTSTRSSSARNASARVCTCWRQTSMALSNSRRSGGSSSRSAKARTAARLSGFPDERLPPRVLS